MSAYPVSAPTTSDDVTLTPTSTYDYNTDTDNNVNANNDTDVMEFLEAQNLKFFSSVAPTIAYLVLLTVAGLVGNTVTFLVYYRRFNPSPTRLYILAISGCDLLTNVINLPTEVPIYRYQYTFRSAGLCKLSWTLVSFLVVLSGSVLVAVAVDRQWTICQGLPRGGSGPTRRAKIALVIAVLTALVLSLPRVYFLKDRPVLVQGAGRNATGWTCSLRGPRKTPAHSAYFGTLNAVLVVWAIIMIACYARIAFYLRRHKKRAAAMTTTTATASATATTTTATASSNSGSGVVVEVRREETTESSFNTPTQEEEEEEEEGVGPGVREEDSAATTDGHSPAHHDQLQLYSHAHGKKRDLLHILKRSGQTKPPRQPAKGKGKKIPSRTTLMLFVLTVVFIVNFVPYLVVSLTREDLSTLSVRGLDPNLTYIMFHSYYLNSVVNPVVYSFCSAKFRQELRRLFRWR